MDSQFPVIHNQLRTKAGFIMNIETHTDNNVEVKGETAPKHNIRVSVLGRYP